MRFHGAQLLGVELDSQDKLPEGWNDGIPATNTLHLSYAIGETSLELKLVFMDDHVVVNVLTPNETVHTIDAEISKVIIATEPPFTDVYRIFGVGMMDFACRFANELCTSWSLVMKRTKEQEEQQNKKSRQDQTARGTAVPQPPPQAVPTGGLRMPPRMPGNPYGVGRQDLDPNFGGLPDPGGGMIVGPGHPIFGARVGLGGRVGDDDDDNWVLGPGGRPPGVPPGARFDPFGPVGPGFPGRGGGGRGGRVFGEPNPDHFRPPNAFGGGGGII